MCDNIIIKNSKKDRESNVNDKNKKDKVDTSTIETDTDNAVTTRSSNKYNTRNSKKGNSKVYNKNTLQVKPKRSNKNVSNEDDGDCGSSGDNESSEEEEEDDDDFIVNEKGKNARDNREYKKFLNSMFPSEYMKKKTKDAEMKKEREHQRAARKEAWENRG